MLGVPGPGALKTFLVKVSVSPPSASWRQRVQQRKKEPQDGDLKGLCAQQSHGIATGRKESSTV